MRGCAVRFSWRRSAEFDGELEAVGIEQAHDVLDEALVGRPAGAAGLEEPVAGLAAQDAGLLGLYPPPAQALLAVVRLKPGGAPDSGQREPTPAAVRQFSNLGQGRTVDELVRDDRAARGPPT